MSSSSSNNNDHGGKHREKSASKGEPLAQQQQQKKQPHAAARLQENDGVLANDASDNKKPHAAAKPEENDDDDNATKDPPQTLKRFKSAYMFFSIEKHEEFRELLKDEEPIKRKATEVAKMISAAWKALSKQEQKVWYDMYHEDKARYEAEKAVFKGPKNKAPPRKRAKKDPTSPKRPMSAYLAFSNCRRAKVKRQNPHFTNAEVSRKLSQMWHAASEATKQRYKDEEAKLRKEYKIAMEAWQKGQVKTKKTKQGKQEVVVRQAAELPETVDEKIAGTKQAPREMREHVAHPQPVTSSVPCLFQASPRQHHHSSRQQSVSQASMNTDGGFAAAIMQAFGTGNDYHPTSADWPAGQSELRSLARSAATAESGFSRRRNSHNTGTDFPFVSVQQSPPLFGSFGSSPTGHGRNIAHLPPPSNHNYNAHGGVSGFGMPQMQSDPFQQQHVARMAEDRNDGRFASFADGNLGHYRRPGLESFVQAGLMGAANDDGNNSMLASSQFLGNSHYHAATRQFQ